MYYRLPVESRAGQKIKALLDQMPANHKQRNDLLDEIGVSQFTQPQAALFGGIRYVKLTDELKIDESVFVAVGNELHRPRANTRQGKELQARFDAINYIAKEDINNIINYKYPWSNPAMKLSGDDGYYYFDITITPAMIELEGKYKPISDMQEVLYADYPQ